MTVQYRCRCGQEVTLRPREGVYLVVGILVGLTLLNTVLTALLWYRSPESEGWPEEPVEAVRASSPQSPSTRPSESSTNPGSSGEATATDSPGILRDGGSVTPPEASEKRTPEPGQPPSELGPSLAPTSAPITAPGDGEETPRVVRKAGPRTFRFECPADLDGWAMALLLQNSGPTQNEVDRAMIHLAIARWGSGALRAEAWRRLSAEKALPAALAREWRETDPGQLALELTVDDGDDKNARKQWLSRLDSAWEARWAGLLAEGSNETRSWITSARRALPESADIVFLVDLTESMTAEIGATVEALRTVVPLVADPRGSRRWGWIGYRDEVEGTFALANDPDAFLESLTRWECRSGGDVPEGVDRAVFEALRLGGFEWRDGAERLLLVLGDAPPPYDRISGMLSMVEGAHATEGYRVGCLGILREKTAKRVPGFQELAAAGGGRCRFVSPGEPVIAAWWSLLAGVRAPQWSDTPF